jgi:hypothetical protein
VKVGLTVPAANRLKKAETRLLARAAQNRAGVFTTAYRAATARERACRTLFPQPAKTTVLQTAFQIVARALSPAASALMPTFVFRLTDMGRDESLSS